MNSETSQPTPSGRFVVVPHDDGPYRAFVPAPLPPQLDYDGELLISLSKADRAIGELSGLARTMPNPHLLIRPFVRREAVLSSRIEGTETEIPDLYAYEAGQLRLPGFEQRPPESDIREVANYVRALEYGLSRLSEIPVCLRLIREVHQQLLTGVRGHRTSPGGFRTLQNWIGPEGSRVQDAEFVPPPVTQMNEALDAFEKYLHSADATPPLVRLALIHYQFEAIHPFNDGNGRIGRLLISLLLVSWGLLPSPLLYLSAYLQRHRQGYVEGLRSVSVKGAWREWIAFFLTGVATEGSDATRRAKQLQDLQSDWRARVSGPRTSSLALQLIDRLFERPILTIPEAQEMLGLTYPAAQRHVQRLVSAGILKQVGEATYGRVFAAQAIFDILRADQA